MSMVHNLRDPESMEDLESSFFSFVHAPPRPAKAFAGVRRSKRSTGAFCPRAKPGVAPYPCKVLTPYPSPRAFIASTAAMLAAAVVK